MKYNNWVVNWTVGHQNFSHLGMSQSRSLVNKNQQNKS